MSGLALACLMLVTAAPPAVEDIDFLSPDGLEPVFGKLTLAVDLIPMEARPNRVEFYVDGRFAGSRDEPPYSVEVDVGEDNIEHEFEVAAISDDAVIRRSMVTPRIPINDEVRVRLVQLYVTVENPDGTRRLDLTRDDFVITDQIRGRRNDEEQELISFETGNAAFTAVMLIDASSSMRGPQLRTVLDGAKQFVSRVGQEDQAKLLLFSDRILQETPFTNLVSLLSLSLSGLQAGGGTALNDSLYVAIKRLDGRQGRKVVIVMSDGVDVDSALPMDDVHWTARRNRDVLFYWIRPRPAGGGTGHRSAWKSRVEHEHQLNELRDVVEESGGRIIEIRSLDEVSAALQDILQELREQYLLGYYPSERRGPGTWHRVEVEIRNQPSLKVKTRDRYLER
ncbi:hypothetical protein ABI59_21265 [Acidobacteria bacterium Mor1]|nr:hypothetical protein ABI59_21265 [Acidobacteria bacterium Mor1]